MNIHWLAVLLMLASIVGHMMYRVSSGEPDWPECFGRAYFQCIGIALMWAAVTLL